MKKTFVGLIVAAVLLPVHGFADSSLEEVFKKKLAYTLEFDREESQRALCEKLGIKTPPPPTKSNEENEKEISENVRKLADEKFPDSMRAEVKLEAEEKFQLIKKGDKITVQMKSGQGVRENTGIYMGVFGEKIILGKKEIRIEDLPVDFMEKLDSKKVLEKQNLYVKDNYSLPRLKYREEMEKKLRMEADDEKETYDKFQEAMVEKERLFVEEQKLIALRRAVPIFITKQEELIAAEKDSGKRLEFYRKLAEDINISIKGLGLELGDTPESEIDEILKSIEEYVKVKNETIPKIDKEANPK